MLRFGVLFQKQQKKKPKTFKGIGEAQDGWGGQEPLENSLANPAQSQGSCSRMPRAVWLGLEYLQDWRLHSVSGQPVQPPFS